METTKLTFEQIEAGRTAKGGFTKATLTTWGVPWPPPSGWRQMLMDGLPFTLRDPSEPSMASHPTDCAEARLLRQVVMAVIESGHGDILASLGPLNAYYGHQLPTVADVIGSRPQHAIIEGGIIFDDKVYRFSCARYVG